MKSHVSAADTTAAVLLAHRAGGAAVMIPGAFEVRDQIRVPPSEPDVPAIPQMREVSESDPGRLEREREGGGAPSQRAGRRRGTLVSRLWQSLLHPTQLRA